MANCNHTTTTTPFCPYCGVQLAESGTAQSLLSYLQTKAKTIAEQNDDWELRRKDESSWDAHDRARHRAHRKRKEKLANKWLVWASLVENWIKKEEV